MLPCCPPLHIAQLSIQSHKIQQSLLCVGEPVAVYQRAYLKPEEFDGSASGLADTFSERWGGSCLFMTLLASGLVSYKNFTTDTSSGNKAGGLATSDTLHIGSCPAEERFAHFLSLMFTAFLAQAEPTLLLAPRWIGFPLDTAEYYGRELWDWDCLDRESFTKGLPPWLCLGLTACHNVLTPTYHEAATTTEARRRHQSSLPQSLDAT